MRTGNVFLLLLLVLIGFGFLTYYSIDKTQELIAAREQLAQIQTAIQTLEAQYQTLLAENERLSAENFNLAGANASLQAQFTAIETERQRLAEQVNALGTHLAIFEKAHPVLAWFASSSAYKYAILFFAPAVPITYVVYAARQKRTRTRRFPADLADTPQNFIHTELTPEEFQLILQRRQLLAVRRLPAHLIDGSAVG